MESEEESRCEITRMDWKVVSFTKEGSRGKVLEGKVDAWVI